MMCALARRDDAGRDDAGRRMWMRVRMRETIHFFVGVFRVVVGSSESPSSLTLNEWSNAVWLRTLFHFFVV